MTVVCSFLLFLLLLLFGFGLHNAYPLSRKIIVFITAQARKSYWRYLVSMEALILCLFSQI